MTFSEFILKNGDELLKSLGTHFYLVTVSVAIGLVIAVPLGILLSYNKKIASYVLAVVSIAQTIPGLVMLGIALILFGIGKVPAIVVLSIYAILPILRNTYTGMTEVDINLKEAGRGIGMNKMQLLFKIELPLALPTIIGGMRLSTIYIVSWATLAGLIGAGGLGDLIWTGLSTYNKMFILAGAIPSAVMALLLGSIISLAQKLLTPKGLRIKGVN